MRVLVFNKLLSEILYFHGLELWQILQLIFQQTKGIVYYHIMAYKTASRQTVNLVLDNNLTGNEKEKRGARWSCSSTATRAFSIHSKYVKSKCNHMGYRCQC